MDKAPKRKADRPQDNQNKYYLFASKTCAKFLVQRVSPAQREADVEQEKGTFEILQLLRHAHVEAIDEGDTDGARWLALFGQIVWQKLALETAAWIAPDMLLNQTGNNHPKPNTQRLIISNIIIAQLDSLLPTDLEVAGYAPILLPAWAIEILYNGLQALEEGEVQPLYRPVRGGKHGPAYTLNNLRHRVLEHVEFLVGKGQTVENAIGDLSIVTQVPSDTIESWRKDAKFKTPYFKQMRSLALQAGKHERMIELDPGSTITFSPELYVMIRGFQDEPLKAFGDRYRREACRKPKKRRNGCTA